MLRPFLYWQVKVVCFFRKTFRVLYCIWNSLWLSDALLNYFDKHFRTTFQGRSDFNSLWPVTPNTNTDLGQHWFRYGLLPDGTKPWTEVDFSSVRFCGIHLIAIFTRGQFWPSGIVVACVCLCVRQSWACSSDNSSTVHARITKFGPEKQNTLVKIPIVFWGNWPWPSRSNLTSNSKLTPFWACPNHYSPPILVRISKLGQEMHFSTVKIPVNSGLDWPWTSPSFLIPKLIFLHYGGVHWDCETVHGLFQFCSGTVSQSLHQCTWGTHSQSGMGPLVLECLIWIKQNRHLDCFTVWLFHNMIMLCHILI